jgi:deazaflavin-dependent oxidoreductase (nitroreductase family)
VYNYCRQLSAPPFANEESPVSSTPSPAGRGAWGQALIDDYRANGAATQGPFVGRQVLLLTTIGSRTGEPRTTPLVYTRDGDRLVIVASMGGAPAHPFWFNNLVANPIVTVELGRETFRARATVASPAERRRLYDRHAELHPGFVEYEQKTDRVIPVVLLERISDPA